MTRASTPARLFLRNQKSCHLGRFGGPRNVFCALRNIWGLGRHRHARATRSASVDSQMSLNLVHDRMADRPSPRAHHHGALSTPVRPKYVNQIAPSLMEDNMTEMLRETKKLETMLNHYAESARSAPHCSAHTNCSLSALPTLTCTARVCYGLISAAPTQRHDSRLPSMAPYMPHRGHRIHATAQAICSRAPALARRERARER